MRKAAGGKGVAVLGTAAPGVSLAPQGRQVGAVVVGATETAAVLWSVGVVAP